MNRFVAIAVVVVAMPFVVSLARASFGPEPSAKPRELTAVAEPTSLSRRYGLTVVPMPDVPIPDGRLPMADSRLPITAGREVGMVCPDVRAIIAGDSPFAIVAWGESSQVVNPAETVATPAGDVIVRRIASKSITFAKADTILQCKLPVR